MKNRIKKTKVAIVVISTPALNSTVRSITDEILRVGGLKIVRSSRIGKYASDAELLSEAQQLRNAGAETVYVIASPIPFIKLATNAQAQAYNPTWVGPGTTVGFQVVAQAGCPAIGTAKFLSPFPQLDAIDSARSRLPAGLPQVRRRQPRRHRHPQLGHEQDRPPDARGHRARPVPPELTSRP